ncbi:MAG: AI-2E family transporter [Verrucomicrobia bacterium]|nr:AI-2E family transporter [Verrucomicrobiota bacterium]
MRFLKFAIKASPRRPLSLFKMEFRTAEALEPKSAAVDSPLPQVVEAAVSSPSNIRSFSITGLFFLAIFYTLYFASEFILPVALAVLVSLLLLPVVGFLSKKVHIPEAIGSAMAVAALLFILAGLASLIYQPAASFLQDLPGHLRQIQGRLSFIAASLKEAGHASDQVQQLIGANQGSTAVVTLKSSSIIQVLFSQTPVLLAKIIVVIILSYFLLAHREAFLLKAVKAVPTFQDKRRIVDIAKEIQTNVARYLVSVTLLNFGLGTCVGLGLALLGLSNALMWGVAVFLLNYIPFIGSVAGISMVGLASLIQFDNVGYACLAPLLYLALNSLESNFVTPNILGRWMTLNPVGIFLSFLFWGWLWGVPGMLLAVPILATIKIFCDRVDGLAQLGEFLGD